MLGSALCMNSGNSEDIIEWGSVKRTDMYEIFVSDLRMRIRAPRITLPDRRSGHHTNFPTVNSPAADLDARDGRHLLSGEKRTGDHDLFSISQRTTTSESVVLLYAQASGKANENLQKSQETNDT